MGLDARGFRGILRQLLDEGSTFIREYLPAGNCAAISAHTPRYCDKNIHFPDSFGHMQQASRRLKFDELLFFNFAGAEKGESPGGPAGFALP
ncbi:MAG: hypothetical protein R3B47_19700 [Bacteroidia bacterium]